MEWEYATERWTFLGAHGDEWPGQQAWQALEEQAEAATRGRLAPMLAMSTKPMGPEAAAVRHAYYEWRDAQEREWLNAMGQAQFELVAVYRDEDWGDRMFRSFPIVTVHCYFKRQRLADLPVRPRIGFDPERAVQRAEDGE